MSEPTSVSPAADPGAAFDTTGVTAQLPDEQHTGDTASAGAAEAGRDAGAPTAEDASADPDAAFEALIRGAYKPQYDRRVRETVQKRLKNAGEAERALDGLKPALTLLARKYGVDEADLASLGAAIEADDGLLAEEAEALGVPVPRLREFRRVEAENAALRAEALEHEARDRARADLARWRDEAEAARERLPDLDLGQELKDPVFFSLLKRGIPLENAYFALHRKEELDRAMTLAAAEAKAEVSDAIRSSAARPTENGAAGASPGGAPGSVAALSREQRRDLIRRVQAGERITL